MKNILILATFLVGIVQVNAQAPTVQWTWGYSSTVGNAKAVTVAPLVSSTRISVDTDGDQAIPSLGWSDVRWYALDPVSGTQTSMKVVAGSGNDFSGNSVAVSGDTSHLMVSSYNGTLSSLGMHDASGSYTQPRFVQLIGDSAYQAIVPTSGWGPDFATGLTGHGLVADGDHVWVLTQRQVGAPDVNGVSNPDGWKSLALSTYSTDGMHQETMFFGSAPNGANSDTSEQVSRFLESPDGMLLVALGWTSPANGSTGQCIGWIWIVDKQNGMVSQMQFPDLYSIDAMVTLPGTKDIVVLGNGSRFDADLNQYIPVSKLMRIDPYAHTSSVLYQADEYHSHMAMLPDTTIVWDQYGIDTRAITLEQVDLPTSMPRSSYTFAVAGAEEYLTDLVLDPSDTTIVISGYGLCPNGDPAYATEFPVTYNTGLPVYSAIGAKVAFPLEAFPADTASTPDTTIVTSVAESGSGQAPVSIFPNPAHRNEPITITGLINPTYHVYALNGSVIASGRGNTIPAPEPAGTYLVRVLDANGMPFMKRIMVTN